MKPKSLYNVQGLTTVVTGGATGIGFAYAEAMADNGAQVTLLDVDRAALDRAVGALAARGATARAVVVDVTDSPALDQAISRARFIGMTVASVLARLPGTKRRRP